MRFLRRSLVGLFLVSVTLGLLAFAGQSIRSAVEERMSAESRSRPARERVFAVNVVAFEPGTLTPVLTSFGEVRSRRTLEVRATASGTIVELAGSFEEGGQINAGDRMFQVDPSDAQSALDVARTDLIEVEAEQRGAVAALDLAQDDVAAAIEQLELREQALVRAEELLGRRAGTESAVEAAALAEAAAKQAVLSRRQALASAIARVEQVGIALERRQIALIEAQRRLDDTSLFADFSGTLSNVTVVKGGLVQNNERVADLVDPSALEVSFRVSTSEYARLLDDSDTLINADVTVTLDVLGADLTATGKISRESAGVGEGQTGRLLFAKMDAAQGFRPGDFVTVSIQEPDLRFVMALPAGAVGSDDTVLVLGEEDRLELAAVDVLRRQGDTVIVRSRDLIGKEIVSARSPLLGAGIKVRPLRSTDSGVPEAPAMVELTEERRAKLVAFVEGNKRMPAEAKKRVLAQLSKPQVPAKMVERIESRMGG